jgi:hypothetical protein
MRINGSGAVLVDPPANRAVIEHSSRELLTSCRLIQVYRFSISFSPITIVNVPSVCLLHEAVRLVRIPANTICRFRNPRVAVIQTAIFR